MKNKNILHLGFLFLIALCCGSAYPFGSIVQTEYTIADLQGTWVRKQSNNTAWDNVELIVEGSQGKLLDPMEPNLKVGEIKWLGIKKSGTNTFSYQEMGSDRNYYKASIRFVSINILEISVVHGGAGNSQKWIRKGLIQDNPGDGDDITGVNLGVLAKLKGKWKREKSNNPDNDGMVVEVEGANGKIVEPAKGGFAKEDIKWKRIKNIGPNKYAYSELGSDGTYYSAVMKQIGNDLLKINIGSAGEGNDQTWKRVNDSSPNTSGPIVLSCEAISTATVWKNTDAEVDYIVPNSCIIDVTASLTIQPGTVIEFEPGAGLGVIEKGVLDAAGTNAKPIIFKGANDGHGTWRGIHIETQNNRLMEVKIVNAGGDHVYCCKEPASLFLKDASISGFNNVTIEKGLGAGIYVDGRFGSDFDKPSILFDQVLHYPVVINDLQSMRYWARITTSNMDSSKEYIFLIYGNVDDRSKWLPDDDSFIWYQSKVPYLVNTVIDIKVPVEIRAGTQIEFAEKGGLGVYDLGSLYAKGTSEKPILFKGKENVQGYWRGIHFETDAENLMEHVTIKNAGSDYVYCCNEPAGIFLKGNSRLSLGNSTISDSGGCAVYTMEGTTLAQNDNVFNNNLGGDICTGTYPPVELPCQISEHMTLLDTPAEVDYVVPKDCIVDVNASLTIKDGVVIEFEENSGLTINNGSLFLGGEPNTKIILRGTEDRQGFWRGIHLERETYHYIQYAEIKNAGANSEAAVHFENGNLDIRGTHISDSGGCAIYVQEDANLFANNNTFSNNLAGDICKDDGQSTSNNILKELPCQISEDLVLKDTPAEIDYIVNCVVNVTGSLTVEPGVAIEFGEGAGMVINGEKVFFTQDQNQRNVLVKSAEPKKGN